MNMGKMEIFIVCKGKGKDLKNITEGKSLKN